MSCSDDRGNLGIRFKTTSREYGAGRYVVLTEQTIFDLEELVRAGHSAKDVVGLLRDSVMRHSLIKR